MCTSIALLVRYAACRISSLDDGRGKVRLTSSPAELHSARRLPGPHPHLRIPAELIAKGLALVSLPACRQDNLAVPGQSQRSDARDAVSIHRQQDPRNPARQAEPTTRAHQQPNRRGKLCRSSTQCSDLSRLPARVMSPSPPTTLDSAKRHQLRTTTPEQARGKTKLHPLTSCTRPARLPQKGKQMIDDAWAIRHRLPSNPAPTILLGSMPSREASPLGLPPPQRTFPGAY